ncbi:hypothetical protein AVEN_241805-1 [Araneus ventricosus]|uniref:Uncharacterized protein n=1 Tax=Araneus ventricosus TaxID=182803 RepID=A0A4Y2V0Q3_ARAVE|nr:hypothetical protein AVEN_241805-1 [Araneus ventricosus]
MTLKGLEDTSIIPYVIIDSDQQVTNDTPGKRFINKHLFHILTRLGKSKPIGKAYILLKRDGQHRLLNCYRSNHRGSYFTKVSWLILCCCPLTLCDGIEKCTLINTLTNSARALLPSHHLRILHGRIKLYLPPHGKVRDENAIVKEKGSRGRHNPLAS